MTNSDKLKSIIKQLKEIDGNNPYIEDAIDSIKRAAEDCEYEEAN